MSLDFKEVAAAALAMAPVLLQEWIGGKRVGNEWQGASTSAGGPGNSWCVNLSTGAWGHFGGEQRGGDLISLYAALNTMDQLGALKLVGAACGMSADNPVPRSNILPLVKPPERPAEPIPVPVPPLPVHRSLGEPAAAYQYGQAFIVCRFETPEGKTFQPLTWRDGKWNWKGYPAPRPMFNLSEIEKHASAPVLIVEGEKSCLAARKPLAAYVVVTWAGGAQAVDKTDWSALAGRKVVIWPDADEPGREAAAKLSSILLSSAKSLYVVNVDGQPEGWDVADAVADNWEPAKIAGWMKERAKLVGAPKKAPVAPGETLPAAVHREIVKADVDAPSDESTFVSWDSLGLDTNQGGLPHATLANASAIIQTHPHLRGKIWFDTFQGKIWHTMKGHKREWSDADTADLTVWIQHTMQLAKMHDRIVGAAVAHAARCKSRNSLTDWLDTLVWDGTPRLDMWLIDVLGLDATPYTMAVSKNFPISMIARAYQPGCQVDTVPVLEGRMGINKTKFLEVIGGEWYSALTQAIGDKDFSQAMQGQWLIEIPDMANFGKREHSQILATITIRKDRYRPSYGVHTQDHPRTCILAMTTERDQYLQSEFGRRRFWPLRCTEIDLDATRAMREQVFAEAIVRYKAGATWWEVPADETDEEQMSRSFEDIWTEKVLLYVDTVAQNSAGETLVSPAQILFYGLDMKHAQQDDAARKRVADIMRKAGWISKRTAVARYWKKVKR